MSELMTFYEQYTESLFNHLVAVGCDERELKRLMFDATTGKWKRPVNQRPVATYKSGCPILPESDD
jgi:hypothetical protein